MYKKKCLPIFFHILKHSIPRLIVGLIQKHVVAIIEKEIKFKFWLCMKYIKRIPTIAFKIAVLKYTYAFIFDT